MWGSHEASRGGKASQANRAVSSAGTDVGRTVSPVTVEQATESSRRQTEVRRSQMIV